MISNDVIRSTMPDPLYDQIHTCDHRCQGPAPPGHTCKKGFPRSFSETTHYEEGNCRYVYRCLTEADSWVVPYHAPTLLLWDTHMNAQYVTDRGFARYMAKYIAKTEPSHLLYLIFMKTTYSENIYMPVGLAQWNSCFYF